MKYPLASQQRLVYEYKERLVDGDEDVVNADVLVKTDMPVSADVVTSHNASVPVSDVGFWVLFVTASDLDTLSQNEGKGPRRV